MDQANWVVESVREAARSLAEACWIAVLLGRFSFWIPIYRIFGDRLPPNAALSAQRAILFFLAVGAIPVLGSLFPAWQRSVAPATFGAFLGGLFGLGFLCSLPLRKPTISWPVVPWFLWALLVFVFLLDPAGKPAIPLGPEAPLLWTALMRLFLLSLSLWLATLLAELLILTPILAQAGRRDPLILLLGTGSLLNSIAVTLFGLSGLILTWLLLFHPLPFAPVASGSLLDLIGLSSLFALLLRSFHQILAEPAATAVLMRPRARRSSPSAQPEAPAACRLPLTTHALEMFAVAGTLVAGNFLAARPLSTAPSAVEFRWSDLLLLPLLAVVAAGGHRLFHFSRQLVQACIDLPRAEDSDRVPPVLVQLGLRQWLWAGGVFSLGAMAILLVTTHLH
ncbi:hypothetical protein [Methylacidimicrobium tartarophylax]|uniref:Uncharacterized protein n=1 Tax=Methylacidimicrobium tartarophylax TaxID=1041768 RepID=A0A5E6ME58_9BACT|nr:hypothetical protein [Methylacidimicrobium tartarophylax]VVM06636.1 hypothetical protein MAMT_01345 [Methylacidimicrobium tartarophylax]